MLFIDQNGQLLYNCFMKDNKVDRIIKNAMKQFSKHGYKKTSINSIVEGAGVSKGLLFYHFKNKKSLYIYLVKYVTKIYTEEVINKFDLETTDFLEMIKKSNRVKTKLESRYPYSIDFFVSVMNDEVKFKEIEDFIEEAKNLKNYDLYNHIINNTDQSVFKEGIDILTALKVSTWVAEGYVAEGKLKDISSVNEHLEEFENLLRILLYK